MPGRAVEVPLCPNKPDDAAAATGVGYDTGVYRRAANVRIAPVDGVAIGRSCRQASDHQGLVNNLLITHCMGVEHLVALAARRALERKAAIDEGTAEVAIKPTTVVS